MAVSNTPWSKFTAADYSVDQWHRACIVHDHEGPPTSKDQCKLPVREPDGTLNRNGVHAALAALSGARGGVKLSVADSIMARKALKGYYQQLGEKVPVPKKPAFLKHEDEATLKHILQNGTLSLDLASHPSAPTQPSSTKGGSFDEAKVKRDGNGKFANKASAGAHPKDAEWMKKSALDDLSQQLLANNGTELMNIYEKVAKKYGIAPTAFASHKQAANEAVVQAVDYMNNDSTNAIASMSPSTNQRLLFVANKTTSGIDYRVAHVGKVLLKHDNTATDAPTSLVIVALPKDGDLSRAVGSEEKHATLLFLGDNVSSDIANLVQASVQGFFRTSSWAPFTETVSSVASLGPDGARVWMVDSNSGLRTIRDGLLRMPAIRALFDSNVQFPNYTPHVTIDFPQEGQSTLTDFEETRAGIVRRITFDRIAIWYGDNHNMVWRLPDPTQDAEAMHSEDMVSNFLAQSGIKGMKWGIRRNRGSDGTVEGAVKEGHVEVTETGHHGGGSGHVSADAERFVKTREKSAHEMSDREIKEANNRAELIKKYNDLFNDPNHEMATKVKALQLEKDYRSLHAELHPSTLARVAKLVKTVAPLFGTYKAISKHPSVKIFNKFLNDEMTKAFKASVSSPTTSSSKSNKGAPKQQPFQSTYGHPKTTWQAHVTNVHRTPTPPLMLPGPQVHTITSLPPRRP